MQNPKQLKKTAEILFGSKFISNVIDRLGVDLINNYLKRAGEVRGATEGLNGERYVDYYSIVNKPEPVKPEKNKPLGPKDGNVDYGHGKGDKYIPGNKSEQGDNLVGNQKQKNSDGINEKSFGLGALTGAGVATLFGLGAYYGKKKYDEYQQQKQGAKNPEQEQELPNLQRAQQLNNNIVSQKSIQGATSLDSSSDLKSQKNSPVVNALTGSINISIHSQEQQNEEESKGAFEQQQNDGNIEQLTSMNYMNPYSQQQMPYQENKQQENSNAMSTLREKTNRYKMQLQQNQERERKGSGNQLGQ